MPRLIRVAPLALLLPLLAFSASAQTSSSLHSPEASGARPGVSPAVPVQVVATAASQAASRALADQATAYARGRAEAVTPPAWYRESARLYRGVPVITVNTLAGDDDGTCDAGGTGPTDDCSVLEAAALANSAPGADLIAFDVSGTIPLASTLVLTEEAHLDGTTAPGGAGTVILDGQNTLTSVVQVSGGTGTIIEGMVIGRGLMNGIEVLAPATGVQVVGNLIGTDPAGTDLGNDGGMDTPSAAGVRITESANNTVGGTASGAGNTVAFGRNGIFVVGPGATGNRILGNYVGTDVSGAILSNSNLGIVVQDAEDNMIGGAAMGAGNITGFNRSGIAILGVGFSPTRNVIQGNYVGTDASGATLGNPARGVVVQNGSDTRVGGTAPGEGNTIGNSFLGLLVSSVSGLTATGNVLQGNYVGTNAVGAMLTNTGGGIVIQNAFSTQIGGTASGAGNTVGFSNYGIAVAGFSPLNPTGNIVQGNAVGTNAAGANLGNAGSGILLQDVSGSLVGGSAPGAGNTVGFNVAGAWLFSTSGGSTTGNILQGNFIGTNLTGADLGNEAQGIIVQDATETRIGGSTPGEGNTVAYNGTGVRLFGTSTRRNPILGNAISRNDSLGIDLGIDLADVGVTPNDPGDADTGANGLQNFPVITSLAAAEGGTTVSFSLDSTPETSFRVEVFASGDMDPSGHGEGERFLGATTVTTDASGIASGSLVVAGLVGGEAVAATATSLVESAASAFGESSEFSAAFVLPDVTIEYISSTTSPQRDDTVFIRARATNHSATTVRTRIYFTVDYPTGATRTYSVLSRPFPAGLSVQVQRIKQMRFQLASDAPAGTYTVTLYAAADLADGGAIYDSDRFTFELPPLCIEASAVPCDLTAAASGGTASMAPEAGPNPFRTETAIRYALERETDVDLRVFDARGREVAVLAAGVQAPGQHRAVFAARDLPGGVYMWRLSADGTVTMGRVTLAR